MGSHPLDRAVVLQDLLRCLGKQVMMFIRAVKTEAEQVLHLVILNVATNQVETQVCVIIGNIFIIRCKIDSDDLPSKIRAFASKNSPQRHRVHSAAVGRNQKNQELGTQESRKKKGQSSRCDVCRFTSWIPGFLINSLPALALRLGDFA